MIDSHLVPVTPTSSWGWWREVALRGPGFPADGVLLLAHSPIAAQADNCPGTSATDTWWREFRRDYDDASAELASVLRDVAGQPRFQEALAWQNPNAFANSVRLLMRWRTGERRNTDHRQREQLVARYWQRYCVKNESIGFFGPVGWGRLDRDAPTTGFECGDSLIASSEVFFESWAVEALAARLASDRRIREWLAPRRMPLARIRGTQIQLANGPPHEIDALSAAALSRCDGTVPARELALALLDEFEGIRESADVYAVLDEMVRRRWVSWRLEIGAGPYAVESLRTDLEQIPDETVRAEALGPLTLLEQAREQTRAAAGDPERLRSSLAALSETFTAVTGANATRRAGQAYAGRTPVYLDCRRSGSLEVGSDVLTALEPLNLLLVSAQWLVEQVYRTFGDVLQTAYARLAARDREVGLAAFWLECMVLVYGQAEASIGEIVREYQRRWAEVLPVSDGERVAAFSSADLVADVAARFAASTPQWDGARYCSPDVMIAARDADALRSGEFEVVVGEIHLGNSLRSACFMSQHPNRERFLSYIDADFPRPRLLPALPNEYPPRLTTRTHPVLSIRRTDVQVALTQHFGKPATDRHLLSSDLEVVREDGRLSVVLETGERFDVIELFFDFLVMLGGDQFFALFGDRRHTPRVKIDRLVVSRETWRFESQELEFATAGDPATRFVEARRWWRAVGLPRHVFVKSPVEAKPTFVDFDSPVYVESLARVVRRLGTVADEPPLVLRVVEMLPTLDQAWLTDAQGNRYLSEVRLVAFNRG